MKGMWSIDWGKVAAGHDAVSPTLRRNSHAPTSQTFTGLHVDEALSS